MGEVAKRTKNEPAETGLSPELVHRFSQMAMAIPEDDGSAVERILEQILAAPTLTEVDSPWDVTKTDQLVGHVMRVDWLKRQRSTYAGGLGIFLVVGYTDTHNGEQRVFTTSSVSVVAQLVRAWTLGGCPFYTELVIADRPSENGYYPHHLKMHPAPAAA